MRIGRVFKFLLLGVAAAIGCLRGDLVDAQVRFVSSRAALEANDSVDWNQLGLSFSTAPSPASVSSQGGLALTVSQPSAGFEIYNQNPASGPATGWGGSFAPGDPVLYTAAPGEGPITVQFGTLIYGAGAQVESGQYGAYTGTIEAFDKSGLSLGRFSLNGYSDTLGDNSAIFLGVVSPLGNISKIQFSVSTDRTGDFGLNQLSVLTEPLVMIVPEPSVVCLILVAGAVLVLSKAGAISRRCGLT